MFPENGVGTILLSRESLVNSIVDEVRNGRNKSYYYRGPRASGKSVVLNLIGKKLVELGEEVYYISHAGFLRDLDLGPLKVADADKDRTKKIYFLVDEVHENTRDPSWGFLLKDSSLNLVVIGVGIPQLDGRSPAFAKKTSWNLSFSKARGSF